MPTATGYFREFWEASFIDGHERRSPVCFGLEAVPDEDDFTAVPIELGSPAHGGIIHPDLDGTVVTSESGAWTGLNGLVVETERFGSESKSQNSKSQIDCAAQPLAMNAWVPKVNRDPLSPTVALARVNGLPPRGFLRLQLDRPMDPSFSVRVDLVDRAGQRFTIWENYGAGYFETRQDVWLNFEDFQVYFWGRCSENPVLHPPDVDEIRLRFSFSKAHDPHVVRLSLWEPRGAPNQPRIVRSRRD